MFTVDTPETSDRAAFAVRGQSHVSSEVDAASSTSSALRFHRGSLEIARNGLDCILVLTYLTGGFVLKANGDETEVQTGDIVLLDATRPCTLHATAFTHLSITLPRGAIEPFVADIDQAHGIIARLGTPLNTLLGGAMRALYATASDLGASERHAAAQSFAALAASMVGHARDRQWQQTGSPAKLNLLRQAIESNLASPDLGPDFLISKFGVSRATLYRLFEPLGGVRNYIHQRKLARAYESLVSSRATRERIGVVASRSGFKSSAVFSRAFRNAFDISPSDLRLIGRQHADVERSSPANSEAFMEMQRSLSGAGIYVR